MPCHCPTTGRIGNLVLDGLPRLLSGFQPQASTRRHEVATHVAAAIAQGVEIWQANLLIDPSGVRVGNTSNITTRFA
jgi:hypothetical protein